MAIIEEYAPRLAYWHSKPDDGVYHAMNSAIDYCTGHWVLFMNAGDVFVASDSLSRMFRKIPSGVDVVYGHHFYARDGINEYHPAADFELTWSRLVHGDLWFDWLAGIPGHQATAVRRELLQALHFDTTFRIAADHDLLFRARAAGAKFFNSDELISVYAAGGMSAKNYSLCKQEWKRIASTYGMPAAANEFYERLEAVETTSALKKTWLLMKSLRKLLRDSLRSHYRPLKELPGATQID